MVPSGEVSTAQLISSTDFFILFYNEWNWRLGLKTDEQKTLLQKSKPSKEKMWGFKCEFHGTLF